MKMITTTKIFAIVTFLSVLVSKLNCVCVDCHLSPNASEDVVKRFVMLKFKLRLMERLGMKTEPKIVGTAPMSIINAISHSGLMAGDQATESYEEPSKINDIVFEPYAGPLTTKHGYSFKFQTTSNLKGAYELAGVTIWLPANKATKKHWFQVYDRTWKGRNLLINSSIDIDRSFGSDSDWKAFKLMPNKDWYRTPWKTLHLEIEGINEVYNGSLMSSEELRPRLEVRTRPIKKRVRKRSTETSDCPSNGRCCKHRMTLNLRDIPWIMMPSQIEALVCRGDCPPLHRSRWLWSFLSQIQGKRKPCCVPTKLSPISVIHYNDQRQLVTSEVNNMMVASCGCT